MIRITLRHVTPFIAALTFVVSGCGKSNNAPTAKVESSPRSDSSPPSDSSSSSDSSPRAGSPEPNSAAVVDSWKSFVARCKANASIARDVWMKREGNTDLKITWESDDVKKTDSLVTPVIGEIAFDASALWRVGQLNENEFHSRYRFEFVPDGDTWIFSKGTMQRLDKGYEDPTPQSVTQLEKAGRHIKALFAGGE